MLKLKFPVTRGALQSFRERSALSQFGSEDEPSSGWGRDFWRRRHSDDAKRWPPGPFGGPAGPWEHEPPPPPGAGHMSHWDHRHGPLGPHGPPGPPPHLRPWHHFWRGPGPRHHGPGRKHGPPPIYLINTSGGSNTVQRLDALDSLSLSHTERLNLPHDVPCSSCGQPIIGVRWLCANCPTFPTFDLVRMQKQ